MSLSRQQPNINLYTPREHKHVACTSQKPSMYACSLALPKRHNYENPKRCTYGEAPHTCMHKHTSAKYIFLTLTPPYNVSNVADFPPQDLRCCWHLWHFYFALNISLSIIIHRFLYFSFCWLWNNNLLWCLSTKADQRLWIVVCAAASKWILNAIRASDWEGASCFETVNMENLFFLSVETEHTAEIQQTWGIEWVVSMRVCVASNFIKNIIYLRKSKPLYVFLMLLLFSTARKRWD